MKISTEIHSVSKITGEEKAIELLAKCGFDAFDFSLFDMCGYDWLARKAIKSTHPLATADYLKFARKLKRIGLDNGIVCNQSHAPFPSCCPEIRSYFKRAIECTAEAGGEICVIHPDNDKSAEENAEMYMELLPFAKQYGVKIATENMFNWDFENNKADLAACATPESFKAHLDAVNDDFFVACLDIGHAEIMGAEISAVKMIKTLGSRLKALHIHDNDGKGDLHQIPFSLKINFVDIVKALKEINYDGYLTLEAVNYLDGYTSENVCNGVENLVNSVKRMANMF